LVKIVLGYSEVSLAAATIYLLVFRLVAGMIDRVRDSGTLSKTNG
jgi:hypothetical protein